MVDGYTQKETAERLYISVGTINKVWEIYKFWGCVIDPFHENQGRKKTFNTYDMKVRVFFLKKFFYKKLLFIILILIKRFCKNSLRKKLIGF